MAEQGMAPVTSTNSPNAFDDDDGSAAFFRRQGMPEKRPSQRSLRDFYDEEDERSHRRRSSSRDDDKEDSYFDSRKSRRSKKNSRSLSRSRRSKSPRNSRHDSDSEESHSDDSSSHSVDWSKSTRKQGKSNKKKKSKRNVWEDETTMRQARSVLKNSEHADDLDTVAQVQMATEMATLVTEMKRQREEMESRLKSVEDEKSVLVLEMDRNQKEAEKKVANAELDIVKKEKEDMSLMIANLEQAKLDMEDKLQNAQYETLVLREQQLDTATTVDAMIMERQQLEAKLSNVEVSRDDIHMRLMQAEELSKQLKAEKKAKTKEIHSLRDLGDTPMVEESQRQRRSISKDLKRIEEEKAQFRSMMAQMDM
ncbi:MAG: hypothetical protein SGILL_010741, partial [Bacillariaceae sp.]